MTDPEIAVERALGHLVSAKDLLKAAGAFKAVDRVRAALRSASGTNRFIQVRSSRGKGRGGRS